MSYIVQRSLADGIILDMQSFVRRLDMSEHFRQLHNTRGKLVLDHVVMMFLKRIDI